MRSRAGRRFVTTLLGAPAFVLLCAAAAASEPPGSAETAFEPEEVLMSPREVEVFRSLRHPLVREQFLELFWDQRTPAIRAQWHKRLPLAESEFAGVGTPRARTFLTAGPPQYRLAEICPPPVAPHEIWVYEEGAKIVFVSKSEAGPFELWRPDDWQSLLPEAAPDAQREDLPAVCPRAEELFAALSGAGTALPAAGQAPRDPSWVEDFLDRTTLVPAGADRFEASITVDYPAAVGDLTATLVTLEVEPAGAEGAREFELTGEVFGEEAADAFRIRLAAPAPKAGEPLRLTARRHLAPGPSSLTLKLHDLVTDRYFHTELALEVPVLDRQEAGWVEPGDRLFKLLPPPDGYLTGFHRIATVTTDPGIAKVTFFLDGTRILSKRRPPFSVELDFGVVPRPREVEAVAFDGRGYEVARDQMAVNAGPHRFSVRLVAPHRGQQTATDTRVHAEVETPLGEKLSHVDFYWNEELRARLYQTPFVQTLEPPREAGSSYVRAVAVLEDGHSAEDLVVVNTGATIEAIDVDFVELYASVLDREGAPVTGLAGERFQIFENGVPQTLRRFETVDSLPISAIVVLDSSTSMEEEIRDAERAAAQFFEDVLEPKDRAAVMIFNDTPSLRVPLTNDTVLLGNGLVGIEATGETTLYDSLVYGLYYLTGLRGKRALVLLSDGADSASKFSFDDALEFAKRSGIAIYSIGLGLRSDDVASHRVLRRLALDTGGDCFFIESAHRLDRIYDQIERDLRSQYLLGYQSPQLESRDYREVKVEVEGDGLEVKTVPGYYP